MSQDSSDQYYYQLSNKKRKVQSTERRSNLSST